MKENIEKIKVELKTALESVKTPSELADVKAEFLGKKGKITDLSSPDYPDYDD